MRVLRFLGFVVVALLGILAALFGLLQTPQAQRLLADAISGKSLRVAGLSGFIPTDLHVASIELLDSQGVSDRKQARSKYGAKREGA